MEGPLLPPKRKQQHEKFRPEDEKVPTFFENDLTNTIKRLRFTNNLGKFQEKILNDKYKIYNSIKKYIFVIKTTNYIQQASQTKKKK